MYRVSIELYKQEWKFGRTRNAVGTRVFPQLFRVLPNFHEWLFSLVSSQCFLKETEHMLSVFESSGELEKAVETLACG